MLLGVLVLENYDNVEGRRTAAVAAVRKRKYGAVKQQNILDKGQLSPIFKICPKTVYIAENRSSAEERMNLVWNTEL